MIYASRSLEVHSFPDLAERIILAMTFGGCGLVESCGLDNINMSCKTRNEPVICDTTSGEILFRLGVGSGYQPLSP